MDHLECLIMYKQLPPAQYTHCAVCYDTVRKQRQLFVAKQHEQWNTYFTLYFTYKNIFSLLQKPICIFSCFSTKSKVITANSSRRNVVMITHTTSIPPLTERVSSIKVGNSIDMALKSVNHLLWQYMDGWKTYYINCKCINWSIFFSKASRHHLSEILWPLFLW